MLKTAVLILLSVSIALGVGAWSVLCALEHTDRIGTVSVGPWDAHPSRGTPDADPYTRASFVRGVELPLGGAEGIEFRASRDSAGDTLQRGCTYRIEGMAPAARFFTLHASDFEHAALPPVGPRMAATSSLDLLYAPDGSFTIFVGPVAQSGNWLPIAGSGPMQLVLNLYDTPIANRSDVSEGAFPYINKVGCRA